MQETTPENALNWRELADQLTLAQIAECEQTPNLTHRLNHARRLVAQNIAQAFYADVPLPPESHVIGEWESWGDETGRAYRIVSTAAKRVEDTRLLVSAWASQDSDGLILDDPHHDVPLTYVDEIDEHGYSRERLTITPEAARKLALALIEAADRLDGWTLSPASESP